MTSNFALAGGIDFDIEFFPDLSYLDLAILHYEHELIPREDIELAAAIAALIIDAQNKVSAEGKDGDAANHQTKGEQPHRRSSAQ